MVQAELAHDPIMSRRNPLYKQQADFRNEYRGQWRGGADTGIDRLAVGSDRVLGRLVVDG
jgi:hypothetical protein